jgi:hypothetical protein
MITLTNHDNISILVNTRNITYIKPSYSMMNKIDGSYIMFDEGRSIYVKQNVEYILQLIQGLR